MRTAWSQGGRLQPQQAAKQHQRPGQGRREHCEPFGKRQRPAELGEHRRASPSSLSAIPVSTTLDQNRQETSKSQKQDSSYQIQLEAQQPTSIATIDYPGIQQDKTFKVLWDTGVQESYISPDVSNLLQDLKKPIPTRSSYDYLMVVLPRQGQSHITRTLESDSRRNKTPFG